MPGSYRYHSDHNKDIPFALKCGGQAIRIKSPARSIQTVVAK